MGEKQEVAQFDPQALRDRVAESVRVSFGMLIPDVQFKEMVEKEVTAYFETEQPLLWQEEDRPDKSSSYSRTYSIETLKYSMTPFRLQVWQELNNILKSKICALLSGDNLTAYVNPDGATLSEYLSKKLEEIAPRMAASMLSNLFSSAVEEAKMAIRNELGR